uniref:CDP-diacylglycerol--inositol 3-phosphatidyltransferase n=1 Tax=Toxoplasma gondii TgCATBr9 TaxID=943120 RepID=A0A2T6ISM1_TOXGO|nr:putative phosphatidylinositol synthase [Toxoplasma gondii TgCATBr9]
MAGTSASREDSQSPAVRQRVGSASGGKSVQAASDSDLSHEQKWARELKVFLYVPNIIGYVRIALLLAAAFAWREAYTSLFFVSYVISQCLDAVDGAAARRLGQVSIVGACLDQVVDRLSTCLLYVLNASVYPDFAFAFFIALFLDMGGHWVHFFAAAVVGAKSHKTMDPEVNAILSVYYRSRPVMFSAIVGFEGFFMCLLLLASPVVQASAASLSSALLVIVYVTSPLMIFKTLTNLLQGLYGARRLVACDIFGAPSS